MQLQDLSVKASTKVLLNIRVWDFNLVMNSVIYSFIDTVTRPDQDCMSSERLNFVRRYTQCVRIPKMESASCQPLGA